MPLHMSTPMPSLEGGTDWFNTTKLSSEDFKNHISLIHFFSVSCGSCKESLPEVVKFLDKFKDNNFKMLSVHMPRSEEDTNIELVKEVINDYKLPQPVVVDNWHKITDLFENKYVPSFYLFDYDNNLRHFQAGEKAHKMVVSVIERLIKENSQI